MEKEKNIWTMGYYYLNEIIQMMKEMEKEKNLKKMVNYYFKANI